MGLIKTCVNRQEGNCMILKKKCTEDYNPENHPNNLNCGNYQEKNIRTIEVKSKWGYFLYQVTEHYKKAIINIKEILKGTTTNVYKNRKSLDELLKKLM